MTDKITITIGRDILEHTVVALEYAYNSNDVLIAESIKFLRHALAQKAEPDEQEVALQEIADFGQDQEREPRTREEKEQYAFEDWLASECPSGDVEAVQSQWEESAEYLELQDDTPAQPADIVNPISQQEPVAYRHSKTGRLYDSVEEVPLADGDEWAEPLYATPATQQAPAAWRQWSTKLHDWDYSTNRGDLRSDTPADPLFVAAAQPVPLTDEQRNDCIEAWSSKGWGDRLGEVVRICIAIERAHGIAAAGDKQ